MDCTCMYRYRYIVIVGRDRREGYGNEWVYDTHHHQSKENLERVAGPYSRRVCACGWTGLDRIGRTPQKPAATTITTTITPLDIDPHLKNGSIERPLGRFRSIRSGNRSTWASRFFSELLGTSSLIPPHVRTCVCVGAAPLEGGRRRRRCRRCIEEGNYHQHQQQHLVVVSIGNRVAGGHRRIWSEPSSIFLL